MNYYFGDNREYGADDIKKALGTLVATGGIELGLSDGKAYDAGALNKLISSAVTRGVIPDNNSCLRLDKADGGYEVNPGRGVFADGGVAEVEDKTRVEVSPGQYLYLAYSEVLDDAYFLADSREHTDGGGLLFIPLAYVEKGGAVSDRRVYARGRVPALPSATWNVLREVEFVVDDSTVTYGDMGKGGYVEARHPIDGDMNFMMVEGGTRISTLHLEGGAPKYITVAGGGGANNGHWSDFMSVGYNEGLYKATYLDSGPGYISLRYHFHKSFPSTRRYAYRALVGSVL